MTILSDRYIYLYGIIYTLLILIMYITESYRVKINFPVSLYIYTRRNRTDLSVRDSLRSLISDNRRQCVRVDIILLSIIDTALPMFTRERYRARNSYTYAGYSRVIVKRETIIEKKKNLKKIHVYRLVSLDLPPLTRAPEISAQIFRNRCAPGKLLYRAYIFYGASLSHARLIRSLRIVIT